MKKNIKKNRFYYDTDFLSGASGRSVRILSEYYGPLDRIKKNNINNTIVFFGSARLKSKEQALQDLDLAKTNQDDTNIKSLETDLKMVKSNCTRYFKIEFKGTV